MAASVCLLRRLLGHLSGVLVLIPDGCLDGPLISPARVSAGCKVKVQPHSLCVGQVDAAHFLATSALRKSGKGATQRKTPTNHFLVPWCLGMINLGGFSPDPVLAEASCQFRRREFDPRVGKIHWGMETLSSVLAWETLWAEKPGGMSPMGSQELDTTEGLNHRRHKETLWR